MKSSICQVAVILFLLLISFESFSQINVSDKLPHSLYVSEDKSLYFDTVVSAPGASMEVLYKRAKDWVTNTIRTVDNNVVFDDKEFTQIKNEVMIKVNVLDGRYISFKYSIKFQNEKFKIHCESFLHNRTAAMFENDPFHKLGLLKKNIYSEFDKEFSKLILSNINACLKSEEKW